MNIMVFDTETIGLDKPFCYNIGYVVYDTEEKSVVCRRDYVVEQIWHNLPLFNTAYYADKRSIYVNRLRSRTCRLEKFGYITQQMCRDIRDFDIAHAYAYNSSFDCRVFEYNCDWFKCINPLELLTVYDIRGYVHNAVAFDKNYQAFCEEHELFTESGNYSTTAEAVYRYVYNDPDFNEEHTALADSEIECMILDHCVSLGCDWGVNYPVARTIPRVTTHEFTIIDPCQIAHTYTYTRKRKIKGREGYELFDDR